MKSAQDPASFPLMTHLILSFPGILYDDVRVAFSITNKILRRHDLDDITFERFREVAEGTLDEFIIPEFMPGYDREVLRAELVHATKGEPKAKMCDGAAEVLEELHQNGVACSIVTSKGAPFVRAELERLGLGRWFPESRVSIAGREWTTVFNPDHIGRSKAHGIMHILSENDIPVETCAYVGHMEMDIQEARKTGVMTIAVDWPMSYNSGERLSRAEPDIVVRHFREIPEAIRSLSAAR